MEKPAPPSTTPAPSQTGIHRLILAASAAGALATLCWAALQVRAARSQIHQLEEQLAVESRREALPPLTPAATDAADLSRRLAAAESQQKQAAAESAARLTEMENVISFLRQENSAAQQTIERLSRLQPEPAHPEPAGAVKTRSRRAPAGNANP